MTASSRINSHTDLSRMDETRGNITREECDLLVNEENIDRQTDNHHRRGSHRSGFASLSCRIFLWLHCHMSAFPMVPMAQWVGQQAFGAVGKGFDLQLLTSSLNLIVTTENRDTAPLYVWKILIPEFSKGSRTFGTVRQKIFIEKLW